MGKLAQPVGKGIFRDVAYCDGGHGDGGFDLRGT